MKEINEIWKDITGYEGIYQVSNLGRIKSLKYGKEKIRKPVKHKFGYLQIGLNNGKYRVYKVHRLVAQTFIPNPENKPHIDHINTDRTDNRAENLRWVTAKENANNKLTIEKHKNKLLPKSEKHPSSKPILQFTKEGEFVNIWNCARDIERELGCCNGDISKCCKGKLKTCGGYKWRYYYKGIWLKKHIPQIKKAA